MRAEIDQLKQALKSARQDNDMGRGGGKKGKKQGRRASSRRARARANGAPLAGKGRRDNIRMPWGLEGCVPTLQDGSNRRLCFGYYLNECNAAQPGQQCQKGYHFCAKPGCGKAHAAADHQ